jgi:hypothetical protein
MVKAVLVIKCGQCGKEETVVEILGDRVVDFNLDKMCSDCGGSRMTKKELTIESLA